MKTIVSTGKGSCGICVCSVTSVMSDSLDPMDCSPPGSSVHRISRQEYWSGLPCPRPGDLPEPGIKPASPANSLITEPPGKLKRRLWLINLRSQQIVFLMWISIIRLFNISKYILLLQVDIIYWVNITHQNNLNASSLPFNLPIRSLLSFISLDPELVLLLTKHFPTNQSEPNLGRVIERQEPRDKVVPVDQTVGLTRVTWETESSVEVTQRTLHAN